MIKITITIEETSENKAKKNNTIKGKYIISRSNFGESYILGVPCKVVSEPFMGTYESYAFGKRECMCIKVVSCITGIQYTIPYDKSYFEVHDTFSSVLLASESFLLRGYAIYPHPDATRGIMAQLINKQYYPMDNSYSENTNGGRLWVAGRVVDIVGVPFIGKNPHGDDEWFITVKTKDGEIGKCPFTEWKLLP